MTDHTKRRTALFVRIGAERERQDRTFGGFPHDALKDSEEWTALLMRRIVKATVASDNKGGINYIDLRRELIQLAAVTVAWIETWDEKFEIEVYDPAVVPSRLDFLTWQHDLLKATQSGEADADLAMVIDALINILKWAIQIEQGE